MPAVLRICLYDPAPDDNEPFRPPFERARNVDVVDLFTRWDTLQTALRVGNVDAVVVNLDHDEQSGLLTVQRLTEFLPGCAVVGVSRDTQPDRIIAAMRAGCSQFVRWPVDPQDLTAALERIRRTREPAGTRSRRICLIGASGGSGATTVACNLAIELAQLTDERCAVVDMDLEFGDVTCAFDCKPSYSLADVCRSDVDVDRTMVETALHELPCKVSILARPENVEDAAVVTPGGVLQVFRVLAQMFPFVVVDLPRGTNSITAATLQGADRVLILTQLAVPFLRNAARIYDTLLNMGTPEERIEVVLNRGNASHERISPEEVQEHFGRPVFAIIPNDYRRVTASRDLGHPILTDAPQSPARLAINQMARKLIGEGAPAGANHRGNGGTPGGFWRRKSRRGQTV